MEAINLTAARQAVREAGIDIRVRCVRLGLTQADLAELTDIPRPTLSRIVNGKHVASEQEARAIEEALTTLEATTEKQRVARSER